MSMPKVGWQIAERLREIDNTISDIRVMLSHVEKQLAEIREFAILQNQIDQDNERIEEERSRRPKRYKRRRMNEPE